MIYVLLPNNYYFCNENNGEKRSKKTIFQTLDFKLFEGWFNTIQKLPIGSSEKDLLEFIPNKSKCA